MTKAAPCSARESADDLEAAGELHARELLLRQRAEGLLVELHGHLVPGVEVRLLVAHLGQACIRILRDFCYFASVFYAILDDFSYFAPVFRRDARSASSSVPFALRASRLKN